MKRRLVWGLPVLIVFVVLFAFSPSALRIVES
jgi:hypothetical protein